jgi:hypothetical protein
MMRKLAVTGFVLSLAALGCGSDDATTNKDSGALDGAKLDTPKDQPIGAETQLGPDTALDQAQGSEVKTDVAAEAGSSEAGQVIEAGNKDVKPVDVTPVDTKPGIDVTPAQPDGGAVDTGAAVDSGAAVDGGALDGGSVG